MGTGSVSLQGKNQYYRRLRSYNEQEMKNMSLKVHRTVMPGEDAEINNSALARKVARS